MTSVPARTVRDAGLLRYRYRCGRRLRGGPRAQARGRTARPRSRRPARAIYAIYSVLNTLRSILHNRSIRRRPRLHGAHFPVHLHAAPSEPYTIQRHRGDGSRTGINTAAPARPDRTHVCRHATRHAIVSSARYGSGSHTHHVTHVRHRMQTSLVEKCERHGCQPG